MREGIAKINQQPIAQVLLHMPLKTLDYFATNSLITSYHLTCILQIQALRQYGGVHQITQEHCELTATLARQVLTRRYGGRRCIGETVDFTGDAGEGSIQLCKGEAIKGATGVVSGLKPAQLGCLVEAGADQNPTDLESFPFSSSEQGRKLHVCDKVRGQEVRTHQQH